MEIIKENLPLICVPITGKTKDEIMMQLETIAEKSPDVIEWRADFYCDLHDFEQTIQLVNDIKGKTSFPLLFTIRAEHEGGEKIRLSDREKVELLTEICKQTDVDFIDYEISNETDALEKLRDASKSHHKQFIMSYHNFSETPDERLIIEMANRASELDADIIKIAVMPKDKDDVFRLLEITRKLDNMFDAPIITMSMGEIGGLSRIIGWAYGSILTFGVGIASSAPGQMPVEQLREAIQATKKLLPKW